MVATAVATMEIPKEPPKVIGESYEQNIFISDDDLKRMEQPCASS